MEDGSLAVSQHRTTLHRTPALNIATRCIIVPAPCCMVVNTSLYTEREAWRLHTHTRERRELGCATPTVSRDVHGSRAAHWGARCCSHLCTIRCRTHKHTARQWDMHCSPSQLLSNLSRRRQLLQRVRRAAVYIRRCWCRRDADHTREVRLARCGGRPRRVRGERSSGEALASGGSEARWG